MLSPLCHRRGDHRAAVRADKSDCPLGSPGGCRGASRHPRTCCAPPPMAVPTLTPFETISCPAPAAHLRPDLGMVLGRTNGSKWRLSLTSWIYPYRIARRPLFCHQACRGTVHL